MIQQVRVLVPYLGNLAYGKGDVFDTEGKNVLIAGDNGVGKSSLLFTMAYSFRSSLQFDQKSYMYSRPPFSQYVEFGCRADDTMRRRRSEVHRLKWIMPKVETKTSMSHAYFINSVLANLDLVPDFHSTRDRLRDYLMSHSRCNFKNVSLDEAVDGYLDLLPTLARVLGTRLDKLYGVLGVMEAGSLFKTDIPISRFFFNEIIGDMSGSLVAYFTEPGEDKTELVSVNTDPVTIPRWEGNGKPVILDDRYWLPWSRSSGERTKHVLEQIFERAPDHVLLDEPSMNLDESSQTLLEERLLDDDSMQFFVVAHDRLLKRRLRESPKWTEWNLVRD
jgi:energy-coupling factor transporter ATP-binding protein EcfA2